MGPTRSYIGSRVCLPCRSTRIFLIRAVTQCRSPSIYCLVNDHQTLMTKPENDKWSTNNKGSTTRLR